ncbi:hypothetical protein HDA32_004361 [Spinactinospora alkalitolerans]|uniref:Ferric siderophore reductase C-terminal domain-containing protein n=1 Tax=Spinactinospora alkalitolerans TaxID=687207 RepID=A0A852TZJ9_9ACTN|nr:(2Fe-2S)-binding protein [Spinactinospora alkalitolerans]NYE49241.1 hypothetical protein [Spinactinospora alkalitolerans]
MTRGLPRPEVLRVIGDVAGMGGFFGLSAADAAPSEPGRHSFAGLYSDPRLLDARIGLVQELHEPAEPRVSASIAFLGFAAWVCSPALASACGGALLELPAAELHWRHEPGRPIAPVLVRPRAAAADPGDPAAVAAGLHRTVVEGHLRPLVAAVRARVRVAERLLWGNAASAVGGAVQMISRDRPEWAGAADAIATALIARGPMAGLGTTARPDPARPERFFVRRSCCLYYRAPRGSMCGDCSLLEPATMRRQWRQALAEAR